MSGKRQDGQGSRIAILVPTFNGGTLLEETVASTAGLPPDSYAVIVTDNASEDGSVDRLAGIPNVTVHRNGQNLGRVENWNHALEIAEAAGFSYATFLMAGDLICGDGVVRLRDRMAETGAALGIGRYTIVDEDRRKLRDARAIVWRVAGPLSPEAFLAQSFGIGAMLYGPLGANLYRIDGPVRLRFDPADPTHTDQMATASFAWRAGRPIAYLDAPLFLWRRRAGRFHSAMNPLDRLAGDRRVIERACREADIAPDYPRLRATLLLRCLFLCSRQPRAAWRYLRQTIAEGPMAWGWLMRLAIRSLLRRTPWVVEAAPDAVARAQMGALV